MELTLFLLLMAHFICDFTLQTPLMAEKKNPLRKSVDRSNAMFLPPWGYWMLAHSGTHGFFVAVITGYWQLGVLEVVSHSVIDLLKCYRKINLHLDQALHIMCKIMYINIIVQGFVK